MSCPLRPVVCSLPGSPGPASPPSRCGWPRSSTCPTPRSTGFTGPNWTPRASFLTDVDALAAGEGWVTEWQYSSARDRLAARADTILWLDLPLRVSLRRLVVRSVRRRIRRTPLWAGNVEAPWWHLFTGQDHVLAWAVRSRAMYRRVLPTLPGPSGQPQVVRLSSQREVDVWCERLAART
jgi:hypothetical protein